MSRATHRKVKASSLGHDAYERLLLAVVFADLKPGSVVDEKQIASQFGVGLAAVRAALHRLSLEGMVERRPRIGTVIPELSLRELHDVFEARIGLEGYCAALSAQRAEPAHIAAMERAFVGFEAAIARREFRTLVRMDMKFHRALAASTLNWHIERQIVQLHNHASRFWYFGLSRLEPSAFAADITSHLDVLAAIKKGDAAAAENAMRDLLGHFPDNVYKFLNAGIVRKEHEYERDGSNGRDGDRPQESLPAISGLP